MQNDELEDDRTFCFVIESASGRVHYLSVESRAAILELERAWNCACVDAVRLMRVG